MRRRAIVILLAAALVAVAAACGGDPEPQSAPTSTQGEAPAEGSAQEQINPQDQAFAEDIVLRLEDFPTGWREETDEDDEDDEDLFEVCGIGLSDLTVTGRAESPTFARGEATVATSLAAVLESDEDAERAFALLSGDEATSCLERYFKEQGSSEEGVTVADVRAGALSFPSMGDESAATQIALTLEAAPDLGGDPVEIETYVDIIWIRQANSLAGIVFFDVLTPFPDFEKERLASAVAARMGADVGDLPASTGADAQTGLG